MIISCLIGLLINQIGRPLPPLILRPMDLLCSAALTHINQYWSHHLTSTAYVLRPPLQSLPPYSKSSQLPHWLSSHRPLSTHPFTSHSHTHLPRRPHRRHLLCYGRSPRLRRALAGRIIALSTLLSFFTLPWLITPRHVKINPYEIEHLNNPCLKIK